VLGLYGNFTYSRHLSVHLPRLTSLNWYDLGCLILLNWNCNSCYMLLMYSCCSASLPYLSVFLVVLSSFILRWSPYRFEQMKLQV